MKDKIICIITSIKELPKLWHLRSKKVVVYVNSKSKLCLKDEISKNNSKVILATIPKSGTYMFGEFLKNVMFIDTEIHINREGEIFTDYRFASKEEGKREHTRFNKNVRLNTTLSLVLPGHYVLSHLKYTPEIKRLLKGFRIIFTYRNLKDVLVSYMRWIIETGRPTPKKKMWENIHDEREKFVAFLKNDGEWRLSEIKKIADWFKQENILKISYEEFIGDYGQERQIEVCRNMLRYLNISEDIDLSNCLEKTFGAKTATRSNSRSSRDIYWSEDAEKLFNEIGFLETNNLLGYS